MKKLSSTTLILLLAAAAPAVAQDDNAAAAAEEAAPEAGEAAQDATHPDPLDVRASYGIGLNMGRGFKQQEFEVDIDRLLAGINDGLAGEQAYTDEVLRQTMVEFQSQLRERQQQRRAEEAAANLAAAEAFFAANKEREGVIALESGLQYEVTEEGEGESPKPSDRVRVHYRGTLLDGTQFDSSFDRDEVAIFPVGGVIQGWQEALQLMKPGDKWKIYIPPDLGYGERGSGSRIGPNAGLIFEVEYYGIDPGQNQGVTE